LGSSLFVDLVFSEARSVFERFKKKDFGFKKKEFLSDFWILDGG
jgi:hypothetical protein